MRIQFWGTRGSIATPGPNTRHYGGNTSCVEVRSARGTLVVIDCGTGGRSLAQKLMVDDGGRAGVFCSATPIGITSKVSRSLIRCICPGTNGTFTVRKVCVNRCAKPSPGKWSTRISPFLSIGAQQISTITTLWKEVSRSATSASLPVISIIPRSRSATACRSMEQLWSMPAITSPTRARSVSGRADRWGGFQHAEFMRGADLLIHDAQYTAQEYPTKMGWGHSPVEYVVKLAEQALVKRVALTHHDPGRDDDAIGRLIASMRQTTSVDIFAAREGQVVELKARPAKGSIEVRSNSAELPPEQKLGSPVVLLSIADPCVSAALSDALRAESILARSLGNIDPASLSFVKDRPALAIIEHDPSRIDGIAFCRALRQHIPERRLPVLLIAEQEDADAGTAAGVSDWLIKPFTVAHARTKMRTWLLRNACKRSKRRSHVDETRTLPALQLVSTGGKRPADKIEEFVRVSEKASAREQPGISSEKAGLLWMYGREIAAFDTPAFSNQLGRIIARATSTVARKAS